jgi:hypothetical protein
VPRQRRNTDCRAQSAIVMQRTRSILRPARAWRDHFCVSYAWLVLRNILGWSLILVSFVAGPLVPGPGGIPLFLIGFALVSLPGKRRLLARVLRGRPIRFETRWFGFITLAGAVVGAGLTLSLTQPWTCWRLHSPAGRAFVMVASYLCGAAAAWLIIRLGLRLTNACLRMAPRVRRRARPWLRRHHVRLLPPRWRRRAPHEPGTGPHRLRDEILKLVRRA